MRVELGRAVQARRDEGGVATVPFAGCLWASIAWAPPHAPRRLAGYEAAGAGVPEGVGVAGGRVGGIVG
jgi:hypothetical protein